MNEAVFFSSSTTSTRMPSTLPGEAGSGNAGVAAREGGRKDSLSFISRSPGRRGGSNNGNNAASQRLTRSPGSCYDVVGLVIHFDRMRRPQHEARMKAR